MMRIIHFSDTHEPAVLKFSSFFDKRLIGCANSLVIRRRRYDPSRTARMIECILREKPDCAVFTGDAVSTSEPEEFERAAVRFEPLAGSGIPVIAVPGNHDCYVRDARCRTAMERFYTRLNGEEFRPGPHVRIIGGLRFAVIHCALPTPWILSSGVMTPETASFLAAQAEMKDDRPLVCTGHFPLLREPGPASWRRGLRGAENAAELLRHGSLALSLCGHVHRGYERPCGRSSGEVCAGSVTKYGTFTEIRFEGGKFECLRRSLT